MCCDKNSDKYNKSTEPFFSDTSITKKGLLIYCDLMADLSLFPRKIRLIALSRDRDNCYKECMRLKPV